MRFACPYCQTKYQIPADKMAGGLVRVKCKVCSKVIAVRSPQNTDLDNRAQAGGPPSENQANDHWHYVAGEERVGPRSVQNLIDAIQAGTVTSESFAWRPGMESWEKVGDIQELSEFLPGAPTEIPPPPIDRQETAATSQKPQSRGTGVSGGRPKPRPGRFGRAPVRKRPGAPVGAPKSRVSAQTRRFPGAPGSRVKETAEKPEELLHKPELRATEEEKTQQIAAVEEMKQTVISSSVSSEENTAEVAEYTEFDATLPDSSAIQAIAGELEEAPESEGNPSNEGEQLSLLSDSLELPQATKEKRELTEEEDSTLFDGQEEPSSAATEDAPEDEGGLVSAQSTDDSPEDESGEEQFTEEIPDEDEQSEEATDDVLEDESGEESVAEEIPDEDEQSEEVAEETTDEEAAEEDIAEEVAEETADEEAAEEDIAAEGSEEHVEEAPVEDEESVAETDENIGQSQDENDGIPATDDSAEEVEEDTTEADEVLVLEDELILEDDESEISQELDLDDPSNPDTAGPTLPFHLDEDRRTSLDQLFSPLDSEPTSSESVIVPFAAPEEEEAAEFQNLLIPGEGDKPTPSDDESTSDDLADEPTKLDTRIPESEDSSLPPGIPQIPEEDVLIGDEEDEDEVLESDFFAMDAEEADESSVNFEFAPPELPSKEEIEEGKKELKRLMSENSDEDKSKSREKENAEAKKAQEELKKLGMEAPVSRPSGRRLSSIAAAIVGIIIIAMFVIPEKEEVSPPPEVSTAPKAKVNPGNIPRPTYAPPPVPKVEEAPEVEEKTEQDSDATVGEEATNQFAWKSNFEENSEPAPEKKGTTRKENIEQKAPKKKSSAPLDNRALAGLMGKNDGADLRGLKENTKKALSDMRTATEVSSDVLNKLFVKKSPAIKRCATRHNLTGKVVVKFTVKTSGATANTQVDATPTPPSTDGIDCIEKIVSGWKFPAQDEESVFSKILVF